MLRVFPDLNAVSLAVGEVFASASAASAPGGRFCVALAGGNTPRRAYELIASPPLRDQVPWSRVHVFWGDERCVPPADPRGNEQMARDAMLDRVPIPREHVHAIRCRSDSDRAARSYEQVLLEFFAGPPRFDLVLLGLGADGHTASLKPGTAALGERERMVVGMPDLGEGFERVTLTAPALNRARSVVFAVSGATKAHALREVLEGEVRPDRFPAQLIRPAGVEPIWLVDEAAASLLEHPHPPSDPG